MDPELIAYLDRRFDGVDRRFEQIAVHREDSG
jgi:hypothetical protein